MIDPVDALRDVRRNLREAILPELDSAHDRAVLAAALGILDEVAGRVRLDDAPAAATVEQMLPLLPRWEQAFPGEGGTTATAIASNARAAALERDPQRRREIVLRTAELAIDAAWNELTPERRDSFLSGLRPHLRADLMRQGARDADS